MATANNQFSLELGLADDSVGGDETQARLAWRRLVGETLPLAARTRNWPVSEDHCFARILLDNACGRPWREMVHPPAWKNTPIDLLRNAISLGEAALAGSSDLNKLNNRSLDLRGKRAVRHLEP